MNVALVPFGDVRGQSTPVGLAGLFYLSPIGDKTGFDTCSNIAMDKSQSSQSTDRPSDAWAPTLAEIQEACLRIQATWDDTERWRRNQYKPEPVTIPRWCGAVDDDSR